MQHTRRPSHCTCCLHWINIYYAFDPLSASHPRYLLVWALRYCASQPSGDGTRSTLWAAGVSLASRFTRYAWTCRFECTLVSSTDLIPHSMIQLKSFCQVYSVDIGISAHCNVRATIPIRPRAVLFRETGAFRLFFYI